MTTFRQLIAFVGALSAIACAPDTLSLSGVVALDPSLTPDQSDAALQAVDMWNATRATRLRVTVDTEAPNDGTWIHPGKSRPGSSGLASTGKVYGSQPRIAIAFDAIPQHQWADAIAHELGHALGVDNADHTDHGVMRAAYAPDAPALNCIDQETLDAVCAVNTCSTTARATCSP